MALFAMWAHGTAAQLELTTAGRTNMDVGGRAWTAVAGLHKSDGVTYKGQANTTYTFHFPIPTPVIVNNNRAGFIRAMAFYNARPNVFLRKVNVFDGDFLKGSFQNLSGNGNRTPSPNNFIDSVTSFPLTGPVQWGVDVALTFQFLAEQDLTLYTAGVDFDIP